MPRATKNPQAEFAKLLAAACVRRGYLEKLHAGASPVTRAGDYSDVKVVDRVYTFLARTVFAPGTDKEFEAALERAVKPWVREWDEPSYLEGFLGKAGEGKRE